MGVGGPALADPLIPPLLLLFRWYRFIPELVGRWSEPGSRSLRLALAESVGPGRTAQNSRKRFLPTLFPLICFPAV